MTDRSFERQNDESRERLVRLVERLTPGQLEIDLGEGWTVASAIGHMGFWDRWQAARWTEMLAGRWTSGDDSLIVAEHLANDALHPYWAGVAAHDVPALALEAAGTLDALIASAPDALADAIEGTPSAFLLHRHRHRDEHVDHIERSIAAAEALAAARRSDAPVDRSFVGRNEASLAALRELVGGLSAVDLRRRTGDGAWTVGQVMGHLGFWDRLLAARWRAALAGESGGRPTDLPHEMADLLNDALPPTWEAFSGAGEGVIADTLEAAEEVDRIIVGLPASTPIDAILAERPALLDRSIHRREHTKQIEKLLGMQRG
jgi:hypothetical protein